MWDAHCHETDPAEYELARSVGVTHWLWAGIEPGQWKEAPVFWATAARGSCAGGKGNPCKKDLFSTAVKVCWGLHPWSVLEPGFDLQTAFAALRMQIDAYKPAAIGEIGLDFHRARTPEQRRLALNVFQSQLELARDCNLPVVIHAVKCHPEVIGVLKKIQHDAKPRGIIHSFEGPPDFIEPYRQLGYILSLGPYSLKRLNQLPEEFVLETDAPARNSRLKDLAEVIKEASRRAKRDVMQQSDELLAGLVGGFSA